MFSPTRLFSAYFLLLFFAPGLYAQVAPGYAVIDGTQNPPKIVSANINVAITDSGVGSYILTFDDPVVFFLANSMSKGPVFDAGDTLLTAVLDSSNKQKVSVHAVGISSSEGHSRTDVLFSVKVLSIPIFVNGFENP